MSTFRFRDHEIHHNLAKAYSNRSGNSIYINVYINQSYFGMSLTLKSIGPNSLGSETHPRWQYCHQSEKALSMPFFAYGYQGNHLSFFKLHLEWLQQELLTSKKYRQPPKTFLATLNVLIGRKQMLSCVNDTRDTKFWKCLRDFSALSKWSALENVNAILFTSTIRKKRRSGRNGEP